MLKNVFNEKLYNYLINDLYTLNVSKSRNEKKKIIIIKRIY